MSSDFSVPVVQLGKVGKHPNADSLSITTVEGCPAIFRTGDLAPGALAVYVPVDAVVPETCPGLSFLKFKNGVHRVKAQKLRGIFSMGVLIPVASAFPANDNGEAPPVQAGDDVAARLGIVKYEEPADIGMGTENERDPGFMPIYSIANFRKYKGLLQHEEPISITEKIHGANARFAFRDARLWVGSHRCIKKEDTTNLWWVVAQQQALTSKLADLLMVGKVLYGEVYGQVQDLKYGSKPGEYLFAAFDIYDTNLGRFLDVERFREICGELDIPAVPELYRGPYLPDVTVEPLSVGNTNIAVTDQIREGVVVKPLKERWDPHIGRVVLKLVGEQYLLRKNGTEHH